MKQSISQGQLAEAIEDSLLIDVEQPAFEMRWAV
jgi:hypothetical protein